MYFLPPVLVVAGGEELSPLDEDTMGLVEVAGAEIDFLMLAEEKEDICTRGRRFTAGGGGGVQPEARAAWVSALGNT